MTASLLLSRVLGIIREIIIANKFGQSIYTDAYSYSFQIPDLLFFLIAGGALSSAFIPVFTEYLHTNREDDAWHVFSSVATIMSLAILGFIVVAWVAAPWLAHVVAPGLPADQAAEVYPLIVLMSRIVLPAQFAFFIGGLLFGTLYARQVFSVPGLGPNIYNIGIIFGAVALSTLFNPGVIGMSWGALIGAFAGNIFIPLIAMRNLGMRYSFRIDFQHEGVRKVFKLMAPVVFGLSLPGVFVLFLVSLSSFFGKDSEGIATAFRNANQLMQAPLGVFGQALAIAAFPALSQFFATGRMDMYRDQLVRTMRTVVFLTVPIAMLLLASSADIIKTIFEHNQFTPEDTARTAPLLAAFAIGVPAWCLQPLLMRGFFSIQETKKPIILGTLTTAVFLTLAFASIQLELPPYALAASGSVAAIFLVAILTASLRRSIEDLSFTPVWKTAGLSFVSAIPAVALFAGTFHLAAVAGLGGSKLAGIGILLIFGLAAAWIYFLVAKKFGMQETEYFDRVAKRLNKARNDQEGTGGEG